mmetsp:Transcript_71773/g.126716  ORF Transcript_71773/g.126716 Transcript_71773/m.126716 type:complete len:430 (+) Transcript_71773:287-1576(+)
MSKMYQNVIIVLRPSTFETLQRIQDGIYASKSVDVHDKSSDWGPMSGLVTLDPFFSKKHAGSQPIIQKAFFEDKVAYAKAHSAGQSTHLKAVQLLRPDLKGETVKFKATAKDKASGEFIMDDDGRVSFTFMPPDSDKKSKEHPLMVWAYGDQPVTGDYDLWQLVPHRQSKEIGHDMSGVDTLKTVDVLGGQSVVNDLVQQFRRDINSKFGGCPRIQHGPEMFNFDFMQPLDPHLTVIEPNKQKPVSFSLYYGKQHEANQVFVDAIMAWREKGYVFLENPRYREDPLKLGGEPIRGENIQADRLADFDNKLLEASRMRSLQWALQLPLVSPALGTSRGNIKAANMNLMWSEDWLRYQSKQLDLPAAQSAAVEKGVPWETSAQLKQDLDQGKKMLSQPAGELGKFGSKTSMENFSWRVSNDVMDSDETGLD